jgi:signal transduction histidine kinase
VQHQQGTHVAHKIDTQQESRLRRRRPFQKCVRITGERGANNQEHRHVYRDHAAEQPVPLLAAREDLDEILGNILDDACQWARTSCRVEARVEAGRVLILIDDDGPGITAEVREGVPGRGVRADEAAPGSGLGLSIARDLAQAYGGRTSLEESPLGGLRVAIELQAPRSALSSPRG